MKNLVSVLVALGLAIGFAGAAFAADAPKTKADCEKAKMKWTTRQRAARKRQATKATSEPEGASASVGAPAWAFTEVA